MITMNKNEKDKIMWLSDSPMLTTGFATISWNVLNLYAKKYECHYIAAHNYVGQTIPPGLKFKDGTKLNFFIHGCGRELYAKDILTKKIRQERPKIFGILLDTFMVMDWWLNIDTAPAKTMFYFPSDGGGGLPENCEKALERVDLPIAMSRFAQKQVKKAHNIDSMYIPHACDTNIFYKKSFEEKEKIKEELGLQGKYIVGCVARNQGRKMLDREIKAFKLFCQDKPDAILYMHSDPFDPAAPHNINTLIRRLNLQNRVVFTGTMFGDSFTYKRMNDVYNIMDTFFLSTSGEGFGIPIIEAQACGVPVVATDYTTTQELVIENGQAGEAVRLVSDSTEYPEEFKLNNYYDQPPTIHVTNEICDGTVTGNYLVERGVMSIKNAVYQLNKLYYNEKLREKYGRNGIKKIKKYYTWDAVNPLWMKAAERLI